MVIKSQQQFISHWNVFDSDVWVELRGWRGENELASDANAYVSILMCAHTLPEMHLAGFVSNNGSTKCKSTTILI